MLYTFDNPNIEKERRLLSDFGDEGLSDRLEQEGFENYGPFYTNSDNERRDLGHHAPLTRGMPLYLIVEAKQDPSRPVRTVLTYDHFREIQRFNEWLDKLEYSEIPSPGIPKGGMAV